MTPNQEEALYSFLENVTEPFTLESITAFIRLQNEHRRTGNLATEIAAVINSHNMAFRLDNKLWVSRRGYFEDVPFVITVTKLELLNGILIPGHRCVPFASSAKLPHEYKFFWQGKEIPSTTIEGSPDELYPFYAIFGDECVPQYLAVDNPENESAFFSDPFEEPGEVSVHVFDMRDIYRKDSFVPGDRFVVRCRDWKEGHFDLEKAGKDDWSQADLETWTAATEDGFEHSFSLLGAGASRIEQIAYAYWYGDKRMRKLPAYSLEEFFSQKASRIETVSYGTETRFWFAGKDIPDSKGLMGLASPPDKTYIESLLFNANVPVSEYVVLSYAKDALFRRETGIANVMNRIIPPLTRLKEPEWNALATYIVETMVELRESYNFFVDQGIGPLRQQAGELHSAVVELASQLKKGDIEPSWLPRHTFILLSQLQAHAASLLEDFDLEESLPEADLEAMGVSLDSMVETFREMKEMIQESMDNFRRKNIHLVDLSQAEAPEKTWRALQISIAGTDVWRRIFMPRVKELGDLHVLIQISLGWNDSYPHLFYIKEGKDTGRKNLNDKTKIGEVCEMGFSELQYDYGNTWSVKVMLLSAYQPSKNEVIRCVAGEGAAPPEVVGGPLRFRRILSAITSSNNAEKQAALQEVGSDFAPDLFDMERCNKRLRETYPLDT